MTALNSRTSAISLSGTFNKQWTGVSSTVLLDRIPVDLFYRLSRSGQTPTAPQTASKSEETSPMTKSPSQLHQLLTNGAGSMASFHPRTPAPPQYTQAIISHNTQTPVETARARSSSRESLAALDPAIMALPSSLADMSVSLLGHQPGLLASTSHMPGTRDEQTSVTSQQTLQRLVATLPRSDPIEPSSQLTPLPDALPVPSTTTHLRSPLDFQPLSQRQTDVQHGRSVEEPNGQHTAGTSSLKRNVPVLDKEQMQQALLYLIQVSERGCSHPSYRNLFFLSRTIRVLLRCCMMRISRALAAFPRSRWRPFSLPVFV